MPLHDPKTKEEKLNYLETALATYEQLRANLQEEYPRLTSISFHRPLGFWMLRVEDEGQEIRCDTIFEVVVELAARYTPEVP